MGGSYAGRGGVEAREDTCVCLFAVVLVRSLRDVCRWRLVSGVADILASLLAGGRS